MITPEQLSLIEKEHQIAAVVSGKSLVELRRLRDQARRKGLDEALRRRIADAVSCHNHDLAKLNVCRQRLSAAMKEVKKQYRDRR